MLPALAVLVVLGALAFATPACAHGRHGPPVYRGHHHHRVFVAPRVVYRPAYYQPYYYGRAWYPAHRHHHVVYSFPVYRGGVVIRQPYFYCGNQLFFQGSVSSFGGHIGFHFRF